MNCHNCGNPLENPERPCPVCLLRYAAKDTANSENDGNENVKHGLGPEISRVQAAFPELEILEKIGSGGMGTVFKAFQPKLDRYVALKILYTELAEKPAFAERFAREGKLLARLSHPNIVTIYDFGKNTLDEGTTFFYLIMEYVDGVNLRQAMREEKFSPEQAFSIVPKICEALQYAHDEGVLHRDIKPENILLDTKGRIKIADFGIGKLQRDPESANDLGPENTADEEELLTNSGAVLGTLRYMAPEQLRSPDKVDHRADIYSLGVVFYELLTGELPQRPLSLPSEKSAVDREVDTIVMKAMEKERTRRYDSVMEMKTEIETAASHFSENVKISPQNPPQNPTANMPENTPHEMPYKWPKGPIAALLLVIFAVVSLIVVQNMYVPFFRDYRNAEVAKGSTSSLLVYVRGLLHNVNSNSAAESASELDREVAEVKRAKLEKWIENAKAREDGLGFELKNWKETNTGKAKIYFFWLPLGLALCMAGAAVYGLLYLRKLRKKTEKPGIMPLIFVIFGAIFFIPLAVIFAYWIFCTVFEINDISMRMVAYFVVYMVWFAVMISAVFTIMLVRFLLLATRNPESGAVHYSRAYAALGNVLAGIIVTFFAGVTLALGLNINYIQDRYHLSGVDDYVTEKFQSEGRAYMDQVDKAIRDMIDATHEKRNVLDDVRAKTSREIKNLKERQQAAIALSDSPMEFSQQIEDKLRLLSQFEDDRHLLDLRLNQLSVASDDNMHDARNMDDFFRFSYREFGSASAGGGRATPNIAFMIILAILCATSGIVMAVDYLFRYRKIKGLKGRIAAMIAALIVPAGLFIFMVFVFIVWLSTLNGQTAIAVAIGSLAVVILLLGTAGLVSLYVTRTKK